MYATYLPQKRTYWKTSIEKGKPSIYFSSTKSPRNILQIPTKEYLCIKK